MLENINFHDSTLTNPTGFAGCKLLKHCDLVVCIIAKTTFNLSLTLEIGVFANLVQQKCGLWIKSLKI